MAETSKVSEFWGGLSTGQRIGLVAGALACVGLAGWLLLWALGRDYQVLFSQLAASDAAAIVEQLKRQKIPYQLADEGATIFVPRDQVHDTRLSLMSGNLPLNGGVGFEIFDRQGLGATEQLQRVSYQRALQGELARTISALDPVKQARVHLVISDSSIFRRDHQEPRAAVIMTLRPGAAVSRDQIAGVQRLVAASVAGLDPAKVVVTDQRGITLSMSDPSGDAVAAGDTRLAMKRDVEEYITGKIVTLLDRALGPGRAIVSVDATLNFDEITSTVQNVAPAGTGGSSGVTRRRDASRNFNPGSDLVLDSEAPASSSSDVSASDVEYELSRRVEQVVAAPGGVIRLSVSVVVTGDVPEERVLRLTDLIQAAAGIDRARGDSVVVQALNAVTTPALSEEGFAAGPTMSAVAGRLRPDSTADDNMSSQPAMVTDQLPMGLWSVSAAAVGLFAVILWWISRRQGNTSLSPDDRAQLVADIERAIGEEQRGSSVGSRL